MFDGSRRRRALGTFVLGFSLAAPLAHSQNGGVDAIEAAGPFELSSPTGAFRLLAWALDDRGGPVREFSFEGTRLSAPISPAPTTLGARLRVLSKPVTWGTKLVSEGAVQVTVSNLVSNQLDGSIVSSARSPLGGLVRVPGPERVRAVFLIQTASFEERAALEYLYSLVLRADILGLYDLRTFDKRAALVSQVRLTQSDLLHELARRRNSLVPQPGGGGPAIESWHVVDLRRAPSGRPLRPGEVGAVIEDAEGPLPGASIIFSRAPHSGCAARSDHDGVAACILQDSHGDSDGDDENAPVVATFAGQFDSRRVAPPMVTVIVP